MFDEDNTSSTNTADTNTTDNTELAEFRRWRDDRIKAAGVAEGRQMASAEHAAAELQADSDAIAKLASRGFTLRQCFGNGATAQGHNAAVILHRSRGGTYARLRRLAALEGLVK